MNKFENFIKEIYKVWVNPKSDFRAILFSPRSDFSEIDDIEYSFIFTTPNRLYLYSRKTKEEIEIRDYQLDQYKIKNNILMIKLNNKKIKFEL